MKSSIFFATVEQEFEKYISLIRELTEPHKSHLDVTLWAFFVHIYLAMLQEKGFYIASNFFSRFSQHFCISGITAHLKDLLQFNTLHEALNHHYFKHFCRAKFEIQKRSLALLMKKLKDQQCFLLLSLLKHLVAAEDQNGRGCIAIPPIVTRNEMNPETASSCKTKESTSKWIVKPGTSSSLRNSDVTKNSEDQNVSNCSQSTATKRKESTSNWIEEPGTSSLPMNTDVKTNRYKVDLLHLVIDYGGLEVNCADINQENTLFACGFENSTICVDSLNQEAIELKMLVKKKALLEKGRNSSPIFQHCVTSTFGLDNCLTGHSDKITGLAFATSGLLMSCSDDTTVQAWRMADFKSIYVYRSHSAQIKDIGVSNNGVNFATASIDGTARLWNYNRKIPLMNFYHPFEVNHLKFDPYCRYLATLSDHRIIQLWSIENCCPIWIIPEKDPSYIKCLTISPDGKYIAYADEGGFIKVWDLSSRQLYSKGSAHFCRPIDKLTYNEDSSVLVSCARDRLVSVWNAEKSSLPASKERSTWNHKKLAAYRTFGFVPVYFSFYRSDFLITINSK